MKHHFHHDSQKAYDRDVSRHRAYESFGRTKVSEAEITPEARPAPEELKGGTEDKREENR